MWISYFVSMDLTVAEHISYVLTINTVYKTTKSLHYIVCVCVCGGGGGVGLSMSESKHQTFFILFSNVPLNSLNFTYKAYLKCETGSVQNILKKNYSIVTAIRIPFDQNTMT